MLFYIVFVVLIGSAVAGPAVVKSRRDLERFKSFLEQRKRDDQTRFNARMLANPLANIWENSGKFQGDILLNDAQVQSMVERFSENRNAYIWPNTTWPDNTIVYEFATEFFDAEQIAAIIRGMEDIERQTCIRFRPREEQEGIYVRITGRPDGCYASVGHWEPLGVHTLNLALNTPGVGCFRHTTIVHEWMHILGFLHMQSTHNRDDYVVVLWENILDGEFFGRPDGCYASVGHWEPLGVHTLNLALNTPGVGCFRHTTIVHEWMHILGFLHMQSTHNRDDYVVVLWENILDGLGFNFDKYSPEIVDNLGLPYEYDSCMHYGRYGFSKNGQPTLLPLADDYGLMGQTLYITDYDWLRVNRHYNCPGAWDIQSEQNREHVF